MINVLAKSNPPQSLDTHLGEVRNRAHLLLSPARYSAFRRLGIGEQQAHDLLLSTAWLHDFGKATKEWQDALLSGRKLPQHSLTSFLACLWANETDSKAASPDILSSALAILAHHGQLSKTSFQRDAFEGQSISILADVWAQLAAVKPMPAMLKSIAATAICPQVATAKERVPDLARAGHFRGLYCLLLTLLVEADHLASGGHQPLIQAVGTPHIPGEPTTFQQQVRQRPEETLCAVAGCGSGKTAAALLRAAEFAAQNCADRIVLCLPTRFTSNSLFRDMYDPEKYAYPGGQVGLVHAEALNVLRSLHIEGDEVDFPGTPEEERSKAIRYEHPITISTVDHLLMSLYHGYRYSDRAFGNLMSSVVVFDEVHAYDTTTLNAIREGLNVLQKYSVPTLFMSATLPSTRRRFFGINDDRTVIEQDNPYHPFHVVQVEEPLTTGKGMEIEASSTARRLLRESSGLKLAIYVNQVERAKALARAARKEIPGTQVYCYHSELAPLDRIRLEGEIIHAFKNWQDQPVVLVATQAAELSLDISADRMITEQAPADVLVQRAGRLHRRGVSSVLSEPTSRLPAGFVYELYIAPLELEETTDNFAPGGLPYKDLSLLRRTWDLAPWSEEFEFQRGLRWCEESLTDEPLVRGCGLLKASLEDAVFGNKPQQNFGEDGDEGLVTIRDREDEIISVVPGIYVEYLTDTLDEIAQYQVPIRNTKFRVLEQNGFIEDRYISVVLAKGNPRREKTINYKIRVVRSNLPYDSRLVGFDFRIQDVEMLPQSTDAGFF